MPRTESAAMLAAFESTGFQPVVFVTATFSDETIYVWSGRGSIVWNGQTWSGLGSLLGVSMAEDGVTVEARGVNITLSGLDPALLSQALGNYRLGLPVVVYLGALSGGAVVDSPITSWAGRMDQPTIDVSADTATISINCESRLLDMNIAVDRRYTHQDQQMDHPGDLGFQFVNGLQEMTLFWGHYPATGGNI